MHACQKGLLFVVLIVFISTSIKQADMPTYTVAVSFVEIILTHKQYDCNSKS